MSAPDSNATCYNSFYEPIVDDKRRLQIPSAWRSAQGESEFMLLLWPNGPQKDACLMVLPPAAARKLTERITAMPFGDSQAEALRRYLGRKSAMVTADKAGRMTLPEHMARAVGLESEKKAVLVGMFDRFQIWAPDRFTPVIDGDDALAQEAMKLI
jgi:MraZ protein